jgi:hypothetical protein
LRWSDRRQCTRRVVVRVAVKGIGIGGVLRSVVGPAGGRLKSTGPEGVKWPQREKTSI